MNPDSAKDILGKYGRQLEAQLGANEGAAVISDEAFSEEYQRFKQEMIPELGKYEKWAHSLGNMFSLKVAEKDRIKIQGFLDTAYLDVSASQAAVLAIFAMLGVFFVTVLTFVAIYLINGSTQFMLLFLGLIASMFIFYYTYSMPQRLAKAWKLRAGSEMVPAILYLVVYMKHTSNLERAIGFAAQHLEGPLGLDFKKVLYDVEIGKFSTIKQSLDVYLEKWKVDAPEFVEAMNLIESSLFEPADGRRVEILEKSLQVILDGVYDKMLRYSREVRTPLTNVYMLGIILPTLGLALLPLASTLLGDIFRWPHVFILFNLIVPFFVFYIVSEALMKRPGGYGEASSIEHNPDYEKFNSRRPWVIAFLIALPFFIIGFMPFIFQIDFSGDPSSKMNFIGLQKDYTFGELGLSFSQETQLFGFLSSDGKTNGPIGPGAVILSLFIPLGIALFFSTAYSLKTKDLIRARDDSKKLEQEFAGSLFQLGNRIGDGIPAEIAFGKIAESTRGQTTSEFFSMVNANIQQGGLSLERAVFDEKRGAILYYPSALIATSMRILVESVKKGLQVAARSLMSISEYVKNIQKINQRLQDLLAEIVTDMKSNMTFLAPLLAGVVVGLSAMITFILAKLQILTQTGGDAALSSFGAFGSITQMFAVENMIPPYFIQTSIGIYIVEVVFILTYALVTVDAGKDDLREKNEVAKNLRRSIILYLMTALVAVVALIGLSSIALSGLTTG